MTDARDEPIKSENWAIVDPGADVFTSDGHKLGTVRDAMPEYLEIKAHENVLVDTEIYVPRSFVVRVEDTNVYLGHTAAELRAMDLKTPPALRQRPS